MPEEDARVAGVVETLLRRLPDASLASLVTALVAACNTRPLCAKLLPQRDEPPPPLATDVALAGGRWQLLFGTPFYSTQLQNFERVNRDLVQLLGGEADVMARRSLNSAAQRSLVGNGWRTPDNFLQRPEPAIARLHKLLLEHAHAVVQYGQPRPLSLQLHLFGWAVSLDVGGWMREHVHPSGQLVGHLLRACGRRGRCGREPSCRRLPAPLRPTARRDDGHTRPQ